MRDRLRREPEDARDRVVPAPLARTPGVAAVLRLQALAGNAATSRILAREAKAPAQERTILIEGMGTFPVVAFQLAGAKALTVTLEDGPIGPRLLQASTSGTPIPGVTITASGHAYVLKDVLVASFQHSGRGGGPVTISVELHGGTLEVR